MIRVGFSTMGIPPDVGSHIPGGFAPRVSTGVRDPLQARACVVAGQEETVAVVGVDAISLRFDTVEAARRQVRAACGIPERNVTIAASHTHSGGPSNDVLGTDSDAGYCEWVASQIAEAVVSAHVRLESARVGWAVGACEGLAFNRRFRMRDGSQATNPGKTNPDKVAVAGPVDPEVGVIGFRGTDGRLLGAIGCFTCHCTVVGGREFSGDYPACWQRSLRERVGDDFTLVFLNGACGDVTQVDHTNPDVRESGVAWAERMGEALADVTFRELESAVFSERVAVGSAHGGVRVGYRRPSPQDLEAYRLLLESDAPWDREKWLARDVVRLTEQIGNSRDVECPVDVLRVGDAVIPAAPWQPFCEYGLQIKAARRPRPTLIATFANGMLGYVPTPEAMAGGGYEPTLCRGSKLVPEAGDQIAAETIRLFEALR